MNPAGESTCPGPRRERRFDRSRRSRFAVIVTAGLGLAALGAGGATFALWSDSVVFAGGPVTAGDLQITRGDGTWRQVTPGVKDPAGGSLGGGPGDFTSMPGDVIEITIPVSTSLRGENLQAEMKVEAGASLSSDMDSDAIAATYRVQSESSSATSAETPIGTAVTVPGLQSSNDGAHDDWSVIVTVRVGGTYAWAPLSTTGPQHWTLDDFTISLHQVRSGAVSALEEANR